MCKRKMKVLSIFTFDAAKCVENLPCREDSCIPGQNYSIRELLERAERGQRLNIPMRPLDLVPDTGLDDDPRYDDNLDNMPPICHDIVDVEEYASAMNDVRQHERAMQSESESTEEIPPEAPHDAEQ